MFKYNRGFTLIEILVALLIVSVGLLGVATLQIRGQQINFAAYYRTQATFLADDIMDRMQVNFIEASAGNYTLDGLSNCPNAGNLSTVCDTAGCNRIALRNYDLANWCFSLQNALPMADAIITWNPSPPAPTNAYTIQICWANILDTDRAGCNGQNKEEQVWFHIAPALI